jgi:gliding motility-associated-like protein
MSLRLIYIALFIVLAGNPGLAQVNCTVPLAPVLTSVSVIPESGNVVIRWNGSPSDNISAYIIYYYSPESEGWIALEDTIWNPSARSYTYTNPVANRKSMRFVAAAYRNSLLPGGDGCPSELSNPLNTVFSESSIDTCSKQITLKWNGYTDTPVNVTGYDILVAENSNPLAVAYHTGEDARSFTISDFSTGSNYCFALRAVLEDGTYSYSNKTCLSTTMQRAPEWINADYATVDENNNIALSFSVDPNAEINRFVLEKKTGSGTYVKLSDEVSRNNRVTYTDIKPDLTRINYYRLSAINGCKVPVTISDIASNIVLNHEQNSGSLMLSWNQAGKLADEVFSYNLFMDAGDGFRELSSIITDTIQQIDLKDIMYEISTDKLCFFVRSNESGNPYGINSQFRSATICENIVEKITVPNLFTPNNDLKNDRFRPVLSFTPTDYRLVISDRHGKTVFQSSDFLEEWDGSGGSGSETIFLWFLKLKSPSGKTYTRTGTVTLIR